MSLLEIFPARRMVACFVVALTALVLAGCKKKASGPPQMMAPRVIAVTAKAQRVAEVLSLVGSITANEMVDVRSEVDGVVQEIVFKEGQLVKKGQELVRLDESKLATAVAEGEANFQLSKANFERAKGLSEGQLISQQEFEQARTVFEATRANLELNKRLLKDARIYAPFEGVVGARTISPGQVIRKEAVLTTIVDLDPVKVEFNVPEKVLGQVRVGQDLEIGVATYPDRTFKGKLFFVSPYVDLTNRTALVKAEVPNPNGELKPGMFANLELTVTIRENAVVIPEVALTQTLEGGRAMIFVVDASTNAQLRPVKLGVRMAGFVEVEGVKPGERVIVEGTQKTVPGKAVQLAPEKDAEVYQPAVVIGGKTNNASKS
ncbi:MAG TPA: efflux RND transporter periplasmic adaptor subunit [Verrucomicrobiae bacterium]|nr:efflux RND transporter periplasmic adaptor subunit [Verrucomicrobiae bacterium]